MAVKWCVMSAGGIADRRVIPALLKGSEHEVVALHERVAERAAELEKKYGIPCYASEDEMLGAVECDAVYIGSPVAIHKSQALLTLEYGKHVFIEKPVAMNGREANEILEAFKKAQKQLTIGYMMPYHNLHQKLKEIVASGKIGRVSSVRARFSCWYPDIDGAWRQKRELGGGGVIMDLGGHCLGLVENVLSENITDIKALYSTLSFSYEVEDGAVIIFRTEGGTLGHVDLNFNVPDEAAESKVEFYGTEGYACCYGTLAQDEVGILSYLSSPQGSYSQMQERIISEPVTYPAEGGNLYLKQLDSFARSISDAKLDYSCAEHAVHVQELIDRIYND